MRKKTSPARSTVISAALIFSIAAACSTDAIVDVGPLVSMCHFTGTIAAITDVPVKDVADHKAHGDYFVNLVVDKSSAPGDGIHFRRITDALSAARATRLGKNELEKGSCRITITVPTGAVNGSTVASTDSTLELFPLVIDVPDISLIGSLVMQVDAAGRATGQSTTETTFTPSPALQLLGTSSQTAISERTIIINGHPEGSKGNGAIVQGFVFQSGRSKTDLTTGGQGIGTFRVRDVILRGNRFEGGFNSSMDLQASSAIVENNHISGLGSSCDVCLAGPGNYTVRGNRILAPGGIPGVLVLPTGSFPVPPQVEPFTLPASAEVSALVENNEVSGHLRKPVGVGLRVGAIGVGAASVVSSSKVAFIGNTLTSNTFGIIIEGAFLNASGRRGDIDLTTSGNTVSSSCQNDVLLTLASSQTSLGIQSGLYLMNSVYTVKFGGDIAWDTVWFTHAGGFGNTLTVNGETVPNGSRLDFDAARTC